MKDYYPHSISLIHVETALRQHKNIRSLYGYSERISTFLSVVTNAKQDTILFRICPSEEHHMAQFNKSEFASLSLTVEDEKRFTEWVTAEQVNGIKMLEALLGDGFKTSVSYVVDQNAFCFSIIGTDNTKKHRNMVMTSWSDDLDEVICIGGFKHYVICDGNEWPTRKDGPRWG